jgi:quercetin dioxygenase-like cupin family protein
MSISLDNTTIGFSHSQSHSLQNSVSYADGAIVSKIVTKKETGNLTLFAFDKAQFLSEHTAPFDAIIQIVDGEAKVSINRVDYIVKSGEIIIMPADIPHAVYANTKMKMLLIMIKSK